MTKHQRFIELGWQLIEHKYRYYKLDNAIITDTAYDILEKEYDALADELGKPKYTSDMVGIDMSRPSCQLVEKKLLGLPLLFLFAKFKAYEQQV